MSKTPNTPKKSIINIFTMTIVLLLSATAPAFAKKTLSLDEYLKQVQEKHSGFKAANEASQGARQRSEEGSLLLAPTLFGDFKYIDDQSPRTTPQVTGNKSTFAGYTLGVRKQTSFGLNAALSYNVNKTDIFGANPTFIPLQSYYDAKPLLELSFPLWRNLFGGETKAEQVRIESQALASGFEQSYRLKTILAAAETAYWRLANSREVVNIQKQSLERSIAIREWISRQVKLSLTDRADFLQAEAAVKVKELDVAAAEDNERTAATDFNSLRGIDSATTDVELPKLTAEQLNRIKPPKKEKFRDDVKAAEQRERLVSAVADIGAQRALPSLELYSQLALNGRDSRLATASDDSVTTRYPYALVGVRLNVPLDISTVTDTRAGYRREKIAAELDFDRKVFEQDQQWLDLTKRLSEAQSRLSLANQIVAVQAEKLEHERSRRRKGRTTTYQVLLFEQDYAAAQLSRLQIQNNIVEIVANMKTFGGQSQ